MTLFDETRDLRHAIDAATGIRDTLAPVLLEQVRVCHFKRKPDVDGHKRLGCQRCGRAKKDPAHFGAPASFNVLASGQGSGNAMVYAGLKQTWQAILAGLLKDSGLPLGLSHVAVDGELTFPDRTRRDQGNFRVVIEKALGDALVLGGWLRDDDWDSFEFGRLTYVYVKGESATRLMLFPTP